MITVDDFKRTLFDEMIWLDITQQDYFNKIKKDDTYYKDLYDIHHTKMLEVQTLIDRMGLTAEYEDYINHDLAIKANIVFLQKEYDFKFKNMVYAH